jgi:ABC-type uncharacterized transport system auxiliary subunit
MSTAAVLLLGALGAAVLSGCALTSKSDPVDAHYFTPERPSSAPKRTLPQFPKLALRIGRISAGSSLRDRLVFRSSDHELGYDEERRWTEEPEVYLSRALASTLFEERGLQRMVAGSVPTLDVALVSFEEIRSPRRSAHVEATVVLQDDHSVRLERTIVVDRPVSGKVGDAAPLVEVLGDALRAAVDEIAERTIVELGKLPPPGAGAPCRESP